MACVPYGIVRGKPNLENFSAETKMPAMAFSIPTLLIVSILYLISASSIKTRLYKKDKQRNRNNDVGKSLNKCR